MRTTACWQGWGSDIREVPVFIYGIVATDDPTVRYVGKSQNPHSRLLSLQRGHQCSLRMRGWRDAVYARGRKLAQTILEIVPPGADASEAEACWITLLSRKGKLLNDRYPYDPVLVRAPDAPEMAS